MRNKLLNIIGNILLLFIALITINDLIRNEIELGYGITVIGLIVALKITDYKNKSNG